jgi:hypothetical protein
MFGPSTAADSCSTEDLVFKVQKIAETSVPLTMRTGKPLKVRRWWLDVDYPYRPPIEYRRSGYAMPAMAIPSLGP